MTSPTQQPRSDAHLTEKVASGQKLIIYALLVQVVAGALMGVLGDTVGLTGLVAGGTALIGAVVISFVGMFRIAGGLGYSNVAKVFLLVLLLLPLIGLITLLVLNSRATKRLREAGYKVGLMGARR